MLPLRRILCPTDFTEQSYEALKVANEFASHFSAALIVVYVVPVVIDIPTSADFFVPSDLETMEAHAKETLQNVVKKRLSEKVRIRTKVAIGDPAEEIVGAAAHENVNIIVIATRGLTGWRRFIFGSVAEKVVRLSTCPVLTIQSQPKTASSFYLGLAQE